MVQAGTTEDQGLYNKPSVAVHPGTLAAIQRNTTAYGILYSNVLYGFVA